MLQQNNMTLSPQVLQSSENLKGFFWTLFMFELFPALRTHWESCAVLRTVWNPWQIPGNANSWSRQNVNSLKWKVIQKHASWNPTLLYFLVANSIFPSKWINKIKLKINVDEVLHIILSAGFCVCPLWARIAEPDIISTVIFLCIFVMWQIFVDSLLQVVTVDP